tara:strand:- start:679632 stop:680771 length:1140 start_codon:yes stop_codon:yes gene_type:complete
MVNVLDLQQTDDPRDIVHRTVQALVEGHVVGLPTEATYVLAANALNEQAVARMAKLTQSCRPGVVSLRSVDAAGDYLCGHSRLADRLSRRCWPGPLTLAVACDDEKSATRRLPESVQQRICGEDHLVRYRVVDHRILSHLHRYLSAPLVLADACADDETPPTTIDAIAESIRKEIPLLLDDGPTRYGVETTCVRIVGNRWDLLREGVIERAAMNQFVKPVIVLVCTGNTCRSPMAETLLRELLRQKLDCEDAVRVLSAGVAAGHGSGAAPQAIEVMGGKGLDLTGHSSRPFDESVVQVADLVLTMTRGHRDAILAGFPDLHDRVFTLRRDGGDISDPVGMSVEVYESCAQQIESELTKWLDALGDDFFPTSDSCDQDAN